MTTTPWERISDQAYKSWLINRQVAPDEFNAWTFSDRNEARTQFEQQQQPPQPSGSVNYQDRFRGLLSRAGISTIEEPLMNIVLKHFSSNLLVVNTPDQARNLYYEAALLPRSATQIALKEKGVSVADVFRGSEPSKAVLLHANERGNPRILKITTQKCTEHEMEVWNAAVLANADAGKPRHLVPIRELKFESSHLEVGDLSGGSSIPYPIVRSGILMIHYPATLAQQKIPLDDEVLLHFGRQLVSAVRALHKAGYCHLDIKPANIFVLDTSDDTAMADCFLGDYGAAVKIGEEILERTIRYYPKDGSFVAEPITDMYLLVVTLLEMFGSIPKADHRDQMTMDEIRLAVDAVESEAVCEFLASLLKEGALDNDYL